MKQLESKPHALKVRPVRILPLLSTPFLSMNAYMHTLERSARTRFCTGKRPSLYLLRVRRKHSGMFGRHVPLAEHVLIHFHRAFVSVVYFSTRCAPIETLVRGVTSASAFLAGQPFPASTITMSFRPIMSARLVSSCTILITLPVAQSWLGRTFICSIHRLVGCRGDVNSSMFFV